jgi:selenocysteine-specific elongation factor
MHPLTLGTAGHIDHGKTVLVRALTGVDTDRLPEERERGISIELGYAPLDLPSGRRLSVVDVPGHERFVRTMVAGATGIDLYLMVVAADDGVMPQTREHAAVLAALGVGAGVVAITKADLADPARAREEAAALLPGAEIVPVAAPRGEGLEELRAALDRVAAGLPGRGGGGALRLHVDRSFTIRGAGTVVTGTLWEGAAARGDEVRILPSGRSARVRSVQVHDELRERAGAGQRVALNLAGVRREEVARGDVVVAAEGPRSAGGGPKGNPPKGNPPKGDLPKGDPPKGDPPKGDPPEAADLKATFRVDVALSWITPDARPDGGMRVAVHHGTRETPARLAELGGRYFQLRLEQPLVPARGDRLVIRSLAPPDTLGGGVVLDPDPPRHGPSRDLLARLARLERGEAEPPERTPAPETPRRAEPEPLSPAALELEERLKSAGLEPPPDEDTAALAALREHARIVRLGRDMHLHRDALEDVAETVRDLVHRDGSVSIATLRDELHTSRRYAQALLELLDAERVTLRVGDARVLRKKSS